MIDQWSNQFFRNPKCIHNGPSLQTQKKRYRVMGIPTRSSDGQAGRQVR